MTATNRPRVVPSIRGTGGALTTFSDAFFSPEKDLRPGFVPGRHHKGRCIDLASSHGQCKRHGGIAKVTIH
jgi:hypothetical protein